MVRDFNRPASEACDCPRALLKLRKDRPRRRLHLDISSGCSSCHRHGTSKDCHCYRQRPSTSLCPPRCSHHPRQAMGRFRHPVILWPYRFQLQRLRHKGVHRQHSLFHSTCSEYCYRDRASRPTQGRSWTWRLVASAFWT